MFSSLWIAPNTYPSEKINIKTDGSHVEFPLEEMFRYIVSAMRKSIFLIVEVNVYIHSCFMNDELI